MNLDLLTFYFTIENDVKVSYCYTTKTEISSEFDFSSCKGTIDETIIALVAVEKVFRFYKSPEMGEGDVVTVDRRVDSFLKEHFNRYDFYCSNMTDLGVESNYCEYRKVAEDEQLDDLTLLAVKRN